MLITWGLTSLFLAEWNGNPLQHTCLEKPMDWRAWWPIVHRSQRARHTWSNLGHMHASLPQTSLGVQTLENLLPMQKIWVWSLLQEDPWRREWLPNPVFWPGEFHGQKSLVGYSQWGHKELDMIEQLSLTSLFHHENKGLAGTNAQLFIHSAQCLELCRPIVSRYLMRRCRKHSMNMWLLGCSGTLQRCQHYME